MPSLRSLLLLGSIASICTAHPQYPKPEAEDSDLMSLNDIVNLLPDESIDSALHDHLEGYRDGVFEHGKEAIEAVHQSDPELATRLVDAALHGQIDRQDLRKRQGSNETTTVVTTTSSETVVRDSTTSTRITTDTTTSTTQVTSNNNGGGTTSDGNGGSGTTSTGGNGGSGTSTESGSGGSGTTSNGGNNGGSSATSTATGVLVPVTQTTVDGSGSTITSTTSAFQASAATSTVVAVTKTNAQGSKVTSSETVPAALITTTNAAGKTVTSASQLSTVKVAGGTIVGGSPGNGNGNGNGNSDSYTTTDKAGNSIVLSGTRAGQVITTTDSRGRTVVATFHPGGGEVSQIILQTTNLPGGGKSTITSYANVGATQGSNAGSTGKPGLQSGAAMPTGRFVGPMAAVVGGAVGVAAVLL